MSYLPSEWCDAWRGARYNLGIFFRLETSPPMYLWFGISPIAAAITNLDVDGTVYLGAGLLLDLPNALEVLLNGTTDRIDWMMNGVDPALTANLAADAPSVVGARATLALAPMDERWQLAAAPQAMWEGTADFWAESQPIQLDPTKPRTRTLTLATTTGDASRSLPYFSTWTDRIQKIISSTDRFCERTPRYYQGQAIRWPT
jgi:hypothetical protein